MGSTTIVPETRDVYQEGTDSLRAQVDLAPEQFAAERQFRPQYANLDREILYNNLYGQPGDSTPGYLEILGGVQDWTNNRNRANNTFQRTADILDVQELAPSVMAEIRNANPELYANMDRFDDLARNDGTEDLLGRLDAFGAGLPGASRIGMLDAGEAENMMLDRARTPLERLSRIAGSNRVANVQESELLGNLNTQANEAVATDGRSELLRELEQQAMRELSSGSGLTALERRDIEQSVLSTANAQGRARGNRAMTGVALATDRGMRDRLAERRGFAGQTVDRTQMAENSARNFAMGVEGANQNLTNQNTNINLSNQRDELERAVTNVGIDRTNAVDIPMAEFGFAQAANAARLAREGQNTQRTAVNQQADQIDFAQGMGLLNMRTGLMDRQLRNAGAAAEMRRSTMIDPFQGVLGRSSIVNTGANPTMAGAMAGSGGPQMFDPYNPQIMDIFSSNNNAINAANISNANNEAAMGAGLFSMVGSLGRGMFACWIARRAMGARSKAWRWFRAWLLQDAPEEFRSWYLRRGEEFADAMSADQVRYWAGWMREQVRLARDRWSWQDVLEMEQAMGLRVK